ncbi:MAG: ribosome-associated translation inhibitor RaiA [Deltaproteobacteria bacterium]|nr:ribosome-associated translation inhibitor RaiA [Deltaproteobacteria bacterium]
MSGNSERQREDSHGRRESFRDLPSHPTKYFYSPLDAHVVLSVDSRDRQVAEVTLQARRLTIHGREETADLYSAIDLAMDKVEQQVRKHKTKARLRRRKVKD